MQVNWVYMNIVQQLSYAMQDSVVQEVGCRGQKSGKNKTWAKSLKILAISLKLREKSLNIWSKPAPNVCRNQMKTFFFFGEATPKKVFMIFVTENLQAEVAQNLFGQVWGNSGKNPSHPPKFPCSYTCGRNNHAENAIKIMQRVLKRYSKVILFFAR